MTRQAKKGTQALAAKASRRGRWIVSVVIVAAAALVGYAIWGTSAPAAGPDPSKLVGRWIRPDGGYVLESSECTPDGVLKAGYFNPRPINVARAEWKRQDGQLGVFVELRDVNYPGSTYTLVYDPATDRLAGIYFQAVQQQHFEVIFQRTP